MVNSELVSKLEDVADQVSMESGSISWCFIEIRAMFHKFHIIKMTIQKVSLSQNNKQGILADIAVIQLAISDLIVVNFPFRRCNAEENEFFPQSLVSA